MDCSTQTIPVTVESYPSITVPFARLTNDVLTVHDGEYVTLNQNNSVLTINHTAETFANPYVPLLFGGKWELSHARLRMLFDESNAVKVFKSVTGNAIIHMRDRPRGITYLIMTPCAPSSD